MNQTNQTPVGPSPSRVAQPRKNPVAYGFPIGGGWAYLCVECHGAQARDLQKAIDDGNVARADDLSLDGVVPIHDRSLMHKPAACEHCDRILRAKR